MNPRKSTTSSPIKSAKARPSAAKSAKSPARATASKLSAKQALAPARIEAILDKLAAAYPNAECALHHRNAWELTVATILSAQCTDVRVNLVTPELFRQFPTPAAMAEASLASLEELIRTTGFFRAKAKSISGAAKRVVS
jgi:endonuclease-3